MNITFCYIKRLFNCCKVVNINVPMAPARFRSFVFTWNNPGPDAERSLEQLPGYTYLTFGRELAPTTGTPHLQGFVRFRDGKSLSRVRVLLPGCHVETAFTVTAAIEYCQKGGDFVEFGERPVDDASRGDAEKERWQKTWDHAKSGGIENIDPDIRVRYYNAIKSIGKDYMGKPGRLAGPCGVWIYGRSGLGKTHSVFTKYPDLYSKNASKWWDGYQDQDVVLFDDMDPDCGKWAGRFFKIWADKYPFIGDVKGGSAYIRPRRFIVTSQFTIEECFGEVQTRDALNRRFIVINFVDREEVLVY